MSPVALSHRKASCLLPFYQPPAPFALFSGSSILDIFHEETHGFWREALRTGRLTREESIASLRVLETALPDRRDKDGNRIRLLPENDADITDELLHEAIAQVMESHVLLFRKGGGMRNLPAGLVTRNLSAVARIGAGGRKFVAFMRAARAYFGLAMIRALHFKRAFKSGALDMKTYNEQLSKLFGMTEQDQHHAEANHSVAEMMEFNQEENLRHSNQEIAQEEIRQVTPDSITEDSYFSIGTGPILDKRIARAAAMEPLVVSTDEWKSLSARDRRVRATDMAKRIQKEADAGNPVINEDRGKEIKVSVGGMKHWSRFASDPRKAALVDQMREVLTRSVFLRSEKPDNRKSNESIRAFHRMALPAVIDGQEAVVFLSLLQDNNGAFVYDGRFWK